MSGTKHLTQGPTLLFQRSNFSLVWKRFHHRLINRAKILNSSRITAFVGTRKSCPSPSAEGKWWLHAPCKKRRTGRHPQPRPDHARCNVAYIPVFKLTERKPIFCGTPVHGFTNLHESFREFLTTQAAMRIGICWMFLWMWMSLMYQGCHHTIAAWTWVNQLTFGSSIFIRIWQGRLWTFFGKFETKIFTWWMIFAHLRGLAM